LPIYVGTNKIKSIYVGTTAIKKVYVGTTLVWSGEISKQGTLANLQTNQEYFSAGASVGSYAIIAGGTTVNWNASASVTAYSDTLVQNVDIDPLIYPMAQLAGANAGTAYAIFSGGRAGKGDDAATYNRVAAYNATLTRKTASNLSKVKSGHVGVSVGNYAMFAGGGSDTTLDHYNTSLIKGSIAMPSAIREGAGASSSTHAIFVSYGTASTAYAYSSSLARTNLTGLSGSRTNAAGARVGSYVVFAGGNNGTDLVEAYNSSLVKVTATSLSSDRRYIAAITFKDTAIFAGGMNSDSVATSVLEGFDTTLVKRSLPALSSARYGVTGVVIGNYALFGGGTSTGSWGTTIVEYYE
jgi:hypothetical protein